METSIIITIVMFLFVAVCLFTNKVPGSVACGIAVMVLWIAGVLADEQVYANFISSSIISMIGMMILTGAVIKTDLLVNIAALIKKFKGGETIILVACMFIPFILCQFIGGVTAMITIIPLGIALAEAAGIAPTKIVLPASVGAQAGLTALPIGNAAVQYQVKNTILEGLGITDQAVGFWDLSFSRLPSTIIVMLFVIFIGKKLLPSRSLAQSDMLDPNANQLKKSSFSKGQQYCIYLIFIASLVLISMKVNSMLVSTCAALLVILLRFLKEREAWSSVNWSLIFMMGFMLTIATALGSSGAGQIMADLLQPVYGCGSPFIATSVTFIVAAVLTQFMDNMSLINILTPICALAAYSNGIPVIPVVLALHASCLVSFSTPLASPSSLLAYQLGGYSMKEMLKFNLPLVLISSITSIIWISIYCGLL